MALISCPKCKETFSDADDSCPCCGYIYRAINNEYELQKVRNKRVNAKRNTSKRKITSIGVIILALLIIVSISLLVVKNIKRNNYIDNINLLAETMLIGCGKSETMCNLTYQVWDNAIHEKADPLTNKYTIKEGFYIEGAENNYPSGWFYFNDFNTALAKLYSSIEISLSIESIKSNRYLVDDIMREIQNPTEEFKVCYNTVSNLYLLYYKVTEMAINPTGSFQSFGKEKSENIGNFIEIYTLLSIQIPNK